MIIIGKGLKALIFSNISIALVSLFTGIIIARILNVEERGVVASVYLWATLSTSIFGESLKEYFLSLIQKSTFYSLKIIFFAAFFSFLLGSFFIFFDNKISYVWYVLVFSFVNILTTCYLHNLQLNSEFVFFGKIKAVLPIFYLSFLLPGLYFEYDIDLIFIINLVANSLTLFLLIQNPIENKSVEIERKVFVKVFVTVAISAVLMQFERIYIALLYSDELLAYFMIAATVIVTPISIFFQAFSNYVIVGIRKIKVDFILVLKVLLLVFLGGLGIPLFSYVFSPLIPYIFGSAYSNASEYVLIAGMLGYLFNVKFFLFSVMRGEGFNNELFYFQMLSFIVLIVFVFFGYKLDLKFIDSLFLLFLINFLLLFLLLFVYFRGKASVQK